MTMECSNGGCRDLNIDSNRYLPDYSIKPANFQPAVLPTPKLTSTSNTTQNPAVPALPCNHHQQQMVRVTTSQPSRTSGGGCFYIDKQRVAAAAAPLRGSRWNPTPEQLITLEEIYRSGLKTPTAQQIRQVTAELRNFGRIEGKNVFYWFQNHRARERQKRRRQLMSMYQPNSKQQQQTWTNNTISGIQEKESAGGLTKSGLEVEQQNKWKLPNCSALSDQESSSVLRERMMKMAKSTSSWKLVEQSDSPRPSSDTNASAATLSFTKLLNFQHYYDYDCGMVLTSAPNVCKQEEEEEESRESRTLELFPLKSDNVKGANKETKPSCITRTTSTDTTANFMADDIINFFEQIN